VNRTRTLARSAKPRSDLALLLKFLREGIDCDARTLGPHARLPKRRGKRVTREELAEAVGVTREWYAALESGAASCRASTGLLDRLADVLMVTPEERTRLFHLALPEFGRVQLRDDSVAVLEAFSRLQRLTNVLSAATSVEDVLTTASEQIADWFDRPVLVHTCRRHESGLWEGRAVDDKQDRNDASNVIRDVWNTSTPEQIDALNFHPRLANAGDLALPGLYPLPLHRKCLEVYARRRLAPYAFVGARVRSRTGLVAGLSIWHEFGHSYSASDCAVVRAFAEVASLVLS
jgi:transcriptional regulator with XRE-family HTH domain